MKRSWPARLLEKFGLEVYRRKTMPRSMRLEVDLARLLSVPDGDVLFVDVGANTGQTANYLKQYFPKARIFCLEPIESVFNELLNNTSRFVDVQCLRLALTSMPVDHVTMVAEENSLLSRVVATDAGPGVVRVPAATFDALVNEKHIESVDLLKIDAEGHDLEILQGASESLHAGCVATILCEVSLNPDSVHVLYDDIAEFLRGFGYVCFGFYGFSDWRAAQGGYGYCNALFVRPRKG